MTKQSGFTLIEVLVAAGVIGITASALFGLLSHSLFNLRKVEDLHRYELVAEDVMNRVLLSSTLAAPASAQGSIDDRGAEWDVSVSPWAPPTLEGKPDQAVFRINVVVSWPGRSSRQNIQVESLKVAKVAYSNYDLARTLEVAYPH